MTIVPFKTQSHVSKHIHICCNLAAIILNSKKFCRVRDIYLKQKYVIELHITKVATIVEDMVLAPFLSYNSRNKNLKLNKDFFGVVLFQFIIRYENPLESIVCYTLVYTSLQFVLSINFASSNHLCHLHHNTGFAYARTTYVNQSRAATPKVHLLDRA